MVGPVELPVYRTLQTAFSGGVATITLNRPRQRNAVGDGMREELADAYRWCDRADGRSRTGVDDWSPSVPIVARAPMT